MKPLHPDSEVIDALGGTCKAAAIFNVKPPSVSEWRREGIPEYRWDVIKLRFPEIRRPSRAVGAEQARVA